MIIIANSKASVVQMMRSSLKMKGEKTQDRKKKKIYLLFCLILLSSEVPRKFCADQRKIKIHKPAENMRELKVSEKKNTR